MEENKVKLLSDFQLFQLAQNESLDKDTLTKVRQEFTNRNIPTLKIKEFERQAAKSFDEARKSIGTTSSNPLYTAFAWRRHFNHIAVLKANGRKLEAKTYQKRFYIGIAIYMVLFICAVLLIRR